MPQNQSFRQVWVTNSPALLADGATVENLGVGQIGILDAKTYAAVTSPTYAKNKAIYLVQGTPNIPNLPLMSGALNENEYSKLIRGKLIKGFRAKAARKGRNQIITVGWSGDVADTSTLSAKAGDQKFFYLKLTGPAIDKLYSTQGITRQYVADGGCINDCTDTCADVADPRVFADTIAKQINTDPYINKFVKASTLTSCTPALSAPTTVNSYRFELRICDTRDDVATGIIQAQYPNDVVTRIATEGSSSVYQVIRSVNTLPNSASNAGNILIPDCATCPSGYTSSGSTFVYQVKRADAGSSANLTTVNSDYAIVGPETGVRVWYENGVSSYVLTSTTQLTPANGTDFLKFVGLARNACIITTATTTAWTLAEIQLKYAKDYTLTIADSICGTNRLADIQAAYPTLVVSVVNAAGSCVHTYKTTIYSQAVTSGCSLDTLVYPTIQPFETSTWTEVPVAALAGGTTCLVGVRIEVAFVNRITGECTYDYFPYEGDTIHLQASNFDPNYNHSPNNCITDWKVTEIQSFQYPSGFGASVRKLEEVSKSYALRERSFDPVVREIEGYSFQAVPTTYYDEYMLHFEYEYKSGGWGEKNVDSYIVALYVPAGSGGQLEKALNGYISSIGIDMDPVKILTAS